MNKRLQYIIIFVVLSTFLFYLMIYGGPIKYGNYFSLRRHERFKMDLHEVDLSNFDKYLEGKKVSNIFNKGIIDQLESNDVNNIPHELNQLYRLYKKIISLEDFSLKTFMNLITPYKVSPQKFGVFDNLNVKSALEYIYLKRDIIGLNDDEKVSIKKYYEKMVLKDEINEIIDTKMMKFIHCESSIQKYFKIQNPDNPLVKNFSFYKLKKGDIDYDDYSLQDLELLKELLESIPEQPCEIVDLIMEIYPLRDQKIEKMNRCIKGLKTYLEAQYKMYGIKNPKEEILDDPLTKHKYGDLVFIRDLFKYLVGCDDFKESKDEKLVNDKNNIYNQKNYKSDKFLKLKARYTLNLKQSIDKKKLKTTQIKKCLGKMREYAKSTYKKNKIPLLLGKYPLEKLGKYTQDELETIDNMYDSVPKCDEIDKYIMIHDIYNVYDNIIDQSNHSFGCLHSIEGYLRESLKTDLNITYDQFQDKKYLEKLEFKKIKELMKFIKNVPPCLDITSAGKRHFGERAERHDEDHHYEFTPSHLFHYHNRKPVKYEPSKNMFKKEVKDVHDLEGALTHKSYHPNLTDHQDYPVTKMESILDEGDLLDKFYKSDYFKKKQYKCEKSAKEGLQSAIDRYLDQEKVDGVGSVYRPTIEIDESALDSINLEDIKKSFKAN